MKKILKYFLLGLVILLIVTIGVLTYKGYDMYKKAVTESSLIAKVAEIKLSENYVPLSEIPQMYIDAVVSVEDHRFYTHPGIDLISIGRAFIYDIKTWSLSQGGSTITQQFAKNEYFTQEKKLTRKIAEVFMAFEIERNYEKDEILELYINTIYFGNGYYNIYDACLGYFGKAPKDLNDYECIMLAGIPNAPSIYAPNTNMDLAKQRQKQVLDKMVEYEYLTSEEAEKILNSNS